MFTRGKKTKQKTKLKHPFASTCEAHVRNLDDTSWMRLYIKNKNQRCTFFPPSLSQMTHYTSGSTVRGLDNRDLEREDTCWILTSWEFLGDRPVSRHRGGSELVSPTGECRGAAWGWPSVRELTQISCTHLEGKGGGGDRALARAKTFLLRI